MKKLCIYHSNCADGFGAATVVRMALGSENVDFYAGVHQELPPDVTGQDVILVDFSYKRDVLIKMADKAKNILIIDHHRSAEKDLVNLPTSIKTYFNMEESGAVMTWKYFFPDKYVPKLLRHIQDRDLWQFKLEGTREISACLFSYPYDFEVWENLILMDPKELLVEGEAIERKHFKDIYEFIRVATQTAIIAGYEVPILNAPPPWGSDVGNILGEGNPFAACYYDTSKGRKFSLRSTKEGIDVSKIASLFGGGGHKHAAGFTLKFTELDKLSQVDTRTLS